jgi:hypothetical protein
MSRYRALYDAHGKFAEYEDDELVWARSGALRESAAGPQIVPDIEPYRSMIDGSVIDGRKRHRDHLRAHGCVEVGNDTAHLRPRTPAPLKSRKESLHRMLADVGDRDIRRMIQNEIRNRK